LSKPFWAYAFDRQSSRKEYHHEEASLAFVSLGVAAAFTAPALAGIKDAKNKTECEQAGGVWIEKDQKCGVKTE
jgi:hypothetical protein